MATAQQLKTLDRYVATIHELLIDQLNGLRTGSVRSLRTHKSFYVRMLGQMLYEAPKLHTGMVSVRLIEQKLADFGTKFCLEHHQSRQKGGESLINLVDNALITNVDPTLDDVLQIALLHCQVHYTTAFENEQLRKHQRRCSSEAAYRRANIVLVEAPDLFTKKGRHSKEWKSLMKQKYGPVVEQYNNPIIEEKPLPEMPLVIH